MPDSPIRKLAPFATAAKAAGKRVIHLNIGQPDIATPAVALDAVRQDTRTVIEYSPSEGICVVPCRSRSLLPRRERRRHCGRHPRDHRWFGSVGVCLHVVSESGRSGHHP